MKWQRVIIGLAFWLFVGGVVGFWLLRPAPPPPSREELNAMVVAQYGSKSRLMVGDDEISQAIIERYCLAECNAEYKPKPGEPNRFPNGWIPWLCGPFPHTYDLSQNADGTYHVRYKPENLDAAGKPKDVWKHKGVVNIGMQEFVDEWDRSANR